MRCPKKKQPFGEPLGILRELNVYTRRRVVAAVEGTRTVSCIAKLVVRRGDFEKGKGRDIGYALAARSCEEANSVEACTITAPDVITAFAVPNPNYSSQSRRFFQVWLPCRLPHRADHPIYFGLANFI